MIQDAVIDRLRVLQALAARLTELLAAGDAPGMLVCRLGLDADHAAARLAEHARLLDTAHKGAL